MFFRPSGKAARKLFRIRRSKSLRRCRVQTRGKGECTKLIIGIGQVHPVLSGRFERFQARRIANVQAEIFNICRHLYFDNGVTSFGQEGFAGSGPARLPKNMLFELESSAVDRSGVKPTLRKIASRWRKALHKGDKDKTEAYSTALNGLALLQALQKKVTVFPIEQRDVHSAIGKAVERFHRQIQEIESSAMYRSIQRKQGKGLTKEEYQMAVTRNKLIKQFNKTLAHPERDRAILREVLKNADHDVTVFVLGTGHRSNFLTLAAKSLPEGYLLAWVTPPSLWWWKAILRRLSWGLIIGLVLLMLLGFRTT